MKIKSLLLAFPVLCFACNDASTPADPASNMDANPVYAKQVTGTRLLSVDFNYDEPCNIIGEEYVRSTFTLKESTELTEAHHPNGCEFEWEGNKVAVAFGGTRPYESIYQAEYSFDRLYQAKSANGVAPEAETAGTEQAKSGPEPEGTNAEASAVDSTHHNTDDKHPNHAGVSAATPPLTKPAVSRGTYEAVPDVGDKAVWDAATGAMHVLYNNHIISVAVETKDKPAVKKQRAQSLADVLIEKIAANEYTRPL